MVLAAYTMHYLHTWSFSAACAAALHASCKHADAVVLHSAQSIRAQLNRNANPCKLWCMHACGAELWPADALCSTTATARLISTSVAVLLLLVFA